jgi:hypothetical protein
LFKSLTLLLLLTGRAVAQQCEAGEPRTELGHRVRPASKILSYDNPRDLISEPNARYLRLRLRNESPGAADDWDVAIRDGQQRLLFVVSPAMIRDSIWTPRLPGAELRLQLRGGTERTAPRIRIAEYMYMSVQAEHPFYSVQSDSQPGFHDLYASPTDNALRELGDSVGMLITGVEQQVWCCSGVMITSEHFLTNWHCGARRFDPDEAHWTAGVCADTLIELAWDGATVSREFACLSVVAKSKTKDFALLKVVPLQGTPSIVVPARVRRGGLTEPDAVDLIHHPRCAIKQITPSCPVIATRYHGWLQTASTTEMSHVCDSEGGSSGSPLFDRRGYVVGLHHLGFERGRDCIPVEKVNKAVRIDEILADLPNDVISRMRLE